MRSRHRAKAAEASPESSLIGIPSDSFSACMPMKPVGARKDEPENKEKQE